jgi:hypothetical protein
MKRPAVLMLLLAALLMPAPGGASASPAVPTTLYMHGSAVVGEQDGAAWLASAFTDSALTLSATKPTGDSKSMSYAGMVNDVCTGVPFYPTFVGKLNGTIAGSVTLTLNSVAAPGTFTARVWTDTDIFQCNADYVPPAAEVSFDLPAGQSTVKVVLPIAGRKDRDASSMISVMVFAPTVPGYRGQVGRLMYDGATAASSVVFTCTPRAGRKTCLV